MGTTEHLTTAEQTAWRHFRLANQRVVSRLDAELTGQCAMTLAEYEVLDLLADARGHQLQMGELAELARLSPSGLTRRFDTLVRRGWVKRQRSGDDRRVVLAVLTNAGLAQLERARPVHDRGQREYFFDLLEPGDVESLAQMMGRLASDEQRATVAAT